MDQQRAENLYFYMRQQHKSQLEINTMIEKMRLTYGINLEKLDLRYRKQIGYSPNRFDINNYGTAEYRTMNQTRGMQQV